MVLFRGQRISRASSTSFGAIDGGRIKSFLRSDPQAAELLWTAGMMCGRLPVDEELARKEPDLHDELRQKARDVLAAFSMIFVNDRASKEMLQLAHGQERATWLVRELQKALTSVAHAPQELDPGCVLEGFLNQIAAMIAYRCRVDDTAPFALDVVQILGLQGQREVMYRLCGVPLGEATIQKGGTLTMDESRAAMAQAAGNITSYR
jgi:hypothetical protein